jgi:glycosyltransferase involved in cell wall biosynthesis
MTRLRVLHAITMLELGGAQRNTLDTVAGLSRAEFAVGLACADVGELLPEARRVADVERFELRHLRREVAPWSDVRAYFALREAIRRFRPDIVHTHSSKAGILGRLAARRERVPVVVHSIHGFGFGPHQNVVIRRAFLSVERIAAGWTTAFVAVSRRNLEDGVRLGLFRSDRARVIRSGVDLASFRAHTGGAVVRAELGVPPEAPLVVQIACFKPQKAPERFVELAAKLSGRFPDAHFLLVGDGELRRGLERKRREAGLEGRLHLPGWRRDVPAILDAATVVTLTSRFEGLPRVLVEALAAGVPVVAMAVDGVAEVVRDGENGFLVGEGDVETLSARVAMLLGDPDLRTRLAGAANRGLAEFERGAMVSQQEALYRELAGTAAARATPNATPLSQRRSTGGRTRD